MEVILLEKVKNLGNLGDKVQVKAGYGRNFLIPKNKAVFATDKNIELFEQRRSELEKKAEESFRIAEQRAAKLNEVSLVINAQASDEGKLYGSVGVNEIREAMLERSIELSKKEILMPDGAFHSTGTFTVGIQVHSDVLAQLHIEIVRVK